MIGSKESLSVEVQDAIDDLVKNYGFPESSLEDLITILPDHPYPALLTIDEIKKTPAHHKTIRYPRYIDGNWYYYELRIRK